MKICNQCRQSKPDGEFHKRRASRDGLSYSCKECDRKRLDRYLTPELRKAHNKKYRESLLASEEKMAEHKKKKRNYWEKTSYGVTKEEMYLSFGTACGVCGCDLMELPERHRHIDHCHASGKVRGLLCLGCNTNLGYFERNPSLLFKAAKYLGAA